MIDRLEIKNFRGFRDLTLEGMRRINFILGPNGSGKTALMEAMFLAAANGPQAAFGLHAFRGLPSLTTPLTVPAFSALWEDFFYRFETKRNVEISLVGKLGDTDFTRSLEIGENKGGEITIPLDLKHDERLPVTAEATPRPIFFKWHHAHGGRSSDLTITPTLGPFGLQLGTTAESIGAFFLPARWGYNGPLAADHFTQILKEGREQKFVAAMQKIAPEIESIAVGFDQNAGQLLVKPRGLDRRISASLLSDGLSRIAEILLLISRYGGGFALIDEVENGIHFKNYGKAVKAIDEFAAEFKTQIFITTHNDEILDAFLGARDAKDDDFSVIVCHRNDKGETEARIASGEWAELALRSGIELRV